MKQLILGGARSGKSQFAENLAVEIHSKMAADNPNAALHYMATSPILDAETSERVKLHKARRSDMWKLHETPVEITKQLQKMTETDTVLIDCLTLWINNLVYEKHNVEQEFDKLLISLENSKANIIFVSNELGMGLVPEQKLGREFRDFQGKLNQLIAQKVDKVAFVVAGLPLWMK